MSRGWNKSKKFEIKILSQVLNKPKNKLDENIESLLNKSINFEMKILSRSLNKSKKFEMKILSRGLNKSMQSPKGSEMGVLASPVRMENANSSHIFDYWLPRTIIFILFSR